jgi:glycosyltransferase involved in cell wall biosynthesis
MKKNVTAVVCTKDRYYTSLPLCLTSIMNQTLKPKELIIYDDGKQTDLRKNEIYSYIFSTLQHLGIEWKVNFGAKMGQAISHMRSIDEAKYDYIWRVDDDNVCDPNVLQGLIECIDTDVAAVAGLVLFPDKIRNFDEYMHDKNGNIYSNKIEDVFNMLNMQWGYHKDNKVKSVDHLYSTFVFRKEAAKNKYPNFLSPIAHREETIFTYEMKRAGWKLLVNPNVVTWHYRMRHGGIADAMHKQKRHDWWENDENIFRKIYTEKWKLEIKTSQQKNDSVKQKDSTKKIILNNGIGDHFAFKSILETLVNKFEKIEIFACYPNVFYDNEFENVVVRCLDEYGDYNRNEQNIYLWMKERHWNKSIAEAFESMYINL